MVDPNSKNPTGKRFTPEQYARLKAEAQAPYRSLRKFVYVVFGASGFIGAFIFLAQLVAGRDVDAALPNFALQLGVIALMVFLFRWDQKKAEGQGGLGAPSGDRGAQRSRGEKNVAGDKDKL